MCWLTRRFSLLLQLLPESGHCPLSEPGVDVLELMRQEGFLLQVGVSLF